MVFQSYHLLDDLTVQENIDLPLSYKDIPRDQRQSLVADTLDRFQIVAKKDLYPSQLSGGQQQLVGIARAVIHKPPLLLADEPTGNLHSGQAKEIMELFRELNQQGTTIVQVTHSEANAAYGSRTIQLRDGWLVGDTANPHSLNRRRSAHRECFGTAFLRRGIARHLCLWDRWLGSVSPAQSAFAACTAQTAESDRVSADRVPVRFEMPKSHNPLNAYSPDYVPEPVLANSPRLDRLIRDGKLYLSLKDAIDLALENNLDLAIARYNLPIANTDILRTQAGGFFRGVNTGVVQGTPGGGVGGFGTGAPGAGAGGTTERRRRRRSGRLGIGAVYSRAPERRCRPTIPSIIATGGDEHQTTPLANLQIYGVPSLQLNTGQVNVGYSQAFPTGTSISFSVQQQPPDDQ